MHTGSLRLEEIGSKFAPMVFCDVKVILQSMGELEDRIKRIPRRGRLKPDRGEQLANNPKHLLLLLADIVAVIGPAPAEHFAEFLNRLLGVPPTWNVNSLLGLATSLKLIKAVRKEKGQLLYHRELADGELESFQRRRRMINLAHERARFLCVLQKMYAPETQLSITG